MKKKLLSIILLVTALILVGCGAEESEGEVAGIYMTDGPKYQYQMINTDEIMVQYEDGRPDKKLSDYSGSYTTDTAVYLGNEVGVYLDGEHYSTVVEYVPYTNIDFKRNVGDIDLYILMCREMEAKTDWFEGTITYADGYVGSIDAKEVELKRNADKLVVKITVWGNDALGYEILIPEAWDDMNLNEQSQEEINEWYENLSEGTSEVVNSEVVVSSSSKVKENDWDGLYSIVDAPGLTNIDWDLFNKYMYSYQGSFLGDDELEINVLQVIGKDPRISNDWSELNKQFLTLYGNDDENMARFAEDVALTYNYSSNFVKGFSEYAILYIEPYNSNTDSGLYGNIVEDSITDQEGYDAWKESLNPKVESNVEENAEYSYEEDMAIHRGTINNLCWELMEKGIYTEDIWSEFTSEYDALDWLIANGYLSDPDGKYRESIDWDLSKDE